MDCYSFELYRFKVGPFLRQCRLCLNIVFSGCQSLRPYVAYLFVSKASRRHPYQRLGVQYNSCSLGYQVLKGDVKPC